MPREVRLQFDPTADFYATRPFTAGGRDFVVGELFDKALVPARRLRQMYDLRQLRQQESATVSKRFRPSAA